MTKKAEITPLPWKAERHVDPQWAVKTNDSKFHYVAVTSQGNDEANAAYIVRACNAYPAMLKALWKIYESVDIMEIERIAGEAIQAAAGDL